MISVEVISQYLAKGMHRKMERHFVVLVDAKPGTCEFCMKGVCCD